MARPKARAAYGVLCAIRGVFNIFERVWDYGSDQMGKVLALGAYLHGEANSHACSLPRGGKFCEESEAGG